MQLGHGCPAPSLARDGMHARVVSQSPGVLKSRVA